MSKPLTVEIDGVRLEWGRRFTENWCWLLAGHITDEELLLFNAAYIDAMLDVGPKGDGLLTLHWQPPYSKSVLRTHLKRFLQVRRLLTEPTQAEAVELLAHGEELIRDYARDHWATWRKGWKTG